MSQDLNDKKKEMEFRIKTCSILLRLQSESEIKRFFPEYELTVTPTKQDLQDFLKMKPEWIDFQYHHSSIGNNLRCPYETMSEVITCSLEKLGKTGSATLDWTES